MKSAAWRRIVPVYASYTVRPPTTVRSKCKRARVEHEQVRALAGFERTAAGVLFHFAARRLRGGFNGLFDRDAPADEVLHFL